MKFTLILTVGLLTGCSSFNIAGKLDNRVVCAVAKDKAFVVSEYGPFGISSKVADQDRAVICK